MRSLELELTWHSCVSGCKIWEPMCLLHTFSHPFSLNQRHPTYRLGKVKPYAPLAAVCTTRRTEESDEESRGRALRPAMLSYQRRYEPARK